MESVFLTVAIIGLVEAVRAANANDWETVEVILGAALIGALVGFFNIDHLTIITGVQAGLSAAGAVKLGKVVNGN